MKIVSLSFLFGLAAGQRPNFLAKYRARFQVLIDPECTGPPPVIHVACGGTVRVTGTSNNTISCGSQRTDGSTGFNFVECLNTCQGSACEDIWLAVDGNSHEGPFGEITFECSGNTFDDVDAYMSFEDSGNGACTASTIQNRNFHIGQLGVFCTDVGDYDFDDFLVDCTVWSSGFGTEFHDDIVCDHGDDCGGEACTVNFAQFEVQAVHWHFGDVCVETNNGVSIPTYTSPAIEPRLGTLRSQFQAAWGITTSATGLSRCFGDTANVEIDCVGGDIDFIAASSSTISCTKRGTSVLQCTDPSPPSGDYDGVDFNCTAFGKTPEVAVTYKSPEVWCSDNPTPVDVFVGIQLGLDCGFDQYSHLDRFSECGDRGHLYSSESVIDDGFVGPSCARKVAFPSRSVPGNRQVIQDVSMGTDRAWLLSPDQNCFERLAVTGSPTSSPTQQPTSPPTSSQTVAPTLSPEKEESSSSNMGAIIGGAVGGLAAVCAVVIAICFFQNRQEPEAKKKESVEDISPRELSHSDYTGGTGFDSGHKSYNSPRTPPREVNRNPFPYQPSPLSRGSPPPLPRLYDDSPPGPRSHGQYDSSPRSPVNYGHRDPNYGGQSFPKSQDSYPPQQSPPQPVSRYARASTSTSSGVARGLQAKDQCMSVAEHVVEGVAVSRSPPIGTAHMVEGGAPPSSTGFHPSSQGDVRTSHSGGIRGTFEP